MDNQEDQNSFFCYDHFLNLNNKASLTIYAKTRECSHITIHIDDIPIWLDVQINYFMRDNAMQWQSLIESITIPYEYNTKQQIKTQKLEKLITQITPVTSKIFKGQCLQLSDKPQHIRIHFGSFSNYTKFKNILCVLNDSLCNPDKLPTRGYEQNIRNLNRDLILQASTLYDMAKKTPNPIFKMSEDDRDEDYICKLQRQYGFLLAGWNTLERQNTLERRDILDGMLVCSLDDIKSSKNQGKSPISIMTWDIEVSTKSGFFESSGSNQYNRIICIGCSMYDSYSRKTQKYCITQVPYTIPNQKHKSVQIIQTSNEQNTILEFARLVNKLKPMIITGFNDFMFDWPFVNDRLQMLSDPQMTTGRDQSHLYVPFCEILSPSVNKYLGANKMFKRTQIKVDASNNKTCLYPIIHGSICVDTRIVLMKTQKIEKKSLNDYLEANGLELKLDVDFKDMNYSFKQFMDTSGENIQHSDHTTMHNVMEYCAHDADSCRALWEKRNIMIEHIEIANLSFTPLRYAFYNANGIKVRNMVAREASGYSMPMSYDSFNYRTRDIKAVEYYEKYPGAHVAKPKKGINCTPVIALDFESLYPSIIIAHQLSPEKVLIDISGNLITKSDQQLYVKSEVLEVNFNFSEKNDSQYQNVQGLVQQNGDEGIYSRILQNLFKQRKIIKNQISELSKVPDTEEIQFQIKLLNAKQLALKVYMNTFYGEAGKKESPFFDLIVAGGTTHFGRQYIKDTHQFVGQNDCEIVYGDTDSLYLRPRLSQYKLTTQTPNTQDLIKESFVIAERIQQQVNQLIGARTNGKLKMAFEEVLCPSFFTGKKKYCGVAFTSPEPKPSVTIRDILIKGIDFIKSNYPELVKQMGQQLILEIMVNSANFNTQITDLSAIFQDDYREKYQQTLQQTIISQVKAFGAKVKSLAKSEYDGLVVQKKIKKNNKGGVMKLFNERLVTNSKKQNLLNILNNKTIDDASLKFITNANIIELYFEIDEFYLKSVGIEVPQDGEKINILYVEDRFAVDGFQQLQLYELAQMQGMSINVREYMKMFNTSANRLLMSTFEEDDEDTQKQKAEQLTNPLMPPPNSPHIQIDKDQHDEFMFQLFTSFTRVYLKNGFKLKGGDSFRLDRNAMQIPFTKSFEPNTIFSKRLYSQIRNKNTNLNILLDIQKASQIAINYYQNTPIIKLFRFYLQNYMKILKAELLFNINDYDSYSRELIQILKHDNQSIIQYLYQVDSKMTIDMMLANKSNVPTWNQIIKNA